MNVVMYAPAGRMIALATRYAVSTHVASSCVAPRPPAMCGRATFAIEESSTSMNVASVTVMATIHGLMRGRQGASTVVWASEIGPLAGSTAVAAMGANSIVATGPEIQRVFAAIMSFHGDFPAKAGWRGTAAP